MASPQIAVYVMFFALGTLLWVYYRAGGARLPEGTAADRVLPFFIMRELPPGWRGLLTVAVFAPAMSTTSSALNSLASATVLDFFALRPGNTVLRAKAATLAWGLVVMVAGLLAWRLGSVLELIVKVNSYFYGCLLGVFLLGMLTERAIAAGARYGLMAGMAAVLLCSAWQPALWIWFGGIGCLVSMAVGYCFSLWKFDEIRYRSAERHTIDPSQGINGTCDVAISGGTHRRHRKSAGRFRQAAAKRTSRPVSRSRSGGSARPLVRGERLRHRSASLPPARRHHGGRRGHHRLYQFRRVPPAPHRRCACPRVGFPEHRGSGNPHADGR
jgi:hypothetical protein